MLHCIKLFVHMQPFAFITVCLICANIGPSYRVHVREFEMSLQGWYQQINGCLWAGAVLILLCVLLQLATINLKRLIYQKCCIAHWGSRFFSGAKLTCLFYNSWFYFSLNCLWLSFYPCCMPGDMRIVEFLWSTYPPRCCARESNVKKFVKWKRNRTSTS